MTARNKSIDAKRFDVHRNSLRLDALKVLEELKTTASGIQRCLDHEDGGFPYTTRDLHDLTKVLEQLAAAHNVLGNLQAETNRALPSRRKKGAKPCSG